MSTLVVESPETAAVACYPHAHNYFRAIPDRLPVATLRKLSRLSQVRLGLRRRS